MSKKLTGICWVCEDLPPEPFAEEAPPNFRCPRCKGYLRSRKPGFNERAARYEKEGDNQAPGDPP